MFVGSRISNLSDPIFGIPLQHLNFINTIRRIFQNNRVFLKDAPGANGTPLFLNPSFRHGLDHHVDIAEWSKCLCVRRMASSVDGSTLGLLLRHRTRTPGPGPIRPTHRRPNAAGGPKLLHHHETGASRVQEFDKRHLRNRLRSATLKDRFT
jgi:hypothetical protein